MKNSFAVAMIVSSAMLAFPANAQWLNHPTPNIPRTADGTPNLAAPAPRVDGHPDLAGVWTARRVIIRMPDEALTAKSRAQIREREETYFKDRPQFQCRPYGPETFNGWRRIIQTPSVITILYENLTYRLIFMDGRKLEANPERTWMGYSVGRWEGDTLVVDSFGFNDRTWLDAVGLPHTEALRTTERYRRRNLGQIEVELMVTDAAAFSGSHTVRYNLEFRPDTEMLETVCEDDLSHWVGRVSDSERAAIQVPSTTLRKYVGVYSGLWGTNLRTVRVQLEGDTLYANGVLDERVRLIPHSESFFMATDGYAYIFDPDGDPAAFMVERHVSEDWRYLRQPEK